MINGHLALVRLLRDFMERSCLPWGETRFKYDKDEDGCVILDDQCAEFSFPHYGRPVDVMIEAPSDGTDAVEKLPLGKLAARYGQRVVKGPIDQATWDKIVDMIHAKEAANV